MLPPAARCSARSTNRDNSRSWSIGRALRAGIAVAALVAAAVIGPLAAAPASAHDYLVDSSPKAGSTQTAPIDSVKLTFDDVVLDLSKTGPGALLQVTGPDGELAADLPRRVIGDRDDIGQIRAVHEAGVLLSAKFDATDDIHVIRALAAGCWPIVPASGVYMEMIPERWHEACLYEASVEGVVTKLQDFWHMDRPSGAQELVQRIVRERDAVVTCKAMDDRFAELKF